MSAFSAIESRVMDLLALGLEEINAKNRQVGMICLKYEDSRRTSCGRSKLDHRISRIWKHRHHLCHLQPKVIQATVPQRQFLDVT